MKMSFRNQKDDDRVYQCINTNGIYTISYKKGMHFDSIGTISYY